MTPQQFLGYSLVALGILTHNPALILIGLCLMGF
jgi:hypothetical protein